ncbi:MAG TPA: MaoC family dehydratase [Rhizomicrobium sp.]|jgi:acyl dehydratase|nr:MaoC family dehydratase [Rhizomicrobium sp.]
MWFEDIEIGSKRVLGTHTFTQDEIIAFGQKYDPQPFHVDATAAKRSAYGGIIASGWHTVAVWMRLMVDSQYAAGQNAMRGGVSPGFEDLRWVKPVRPGMTLTYSTEAIEKADLKSRPELGLLKSRNEARDEYGTLYMSFIGKAFIYRKPQGEIA